MTDARTILSAWANLPPEVRALATPIHTEPQYNEVLITFEAVWDEVGRQTDHPLGSLVELLRERLGAYEDRFPTPHSPPHRLLAFLMQERAMTQTELAGVLGITQGNASRLLSGKAALSLKAVRKLAAHFHILPDVFLAWRQVQQQARKAAPSQWPPLMLWPSPQHRWELHLFLWRRVGLCARLGRSTKPAERPAQDADQNRGQGIGDVPIS
ncbi:helix-turn-helix domain-containing protein [Deinococcus marmoris]|uniref:helix-turn-helix domain-containing protein n=1 Tax=Deinococcus marmoris TaxID=249408 RepID=UPI000494EDB6|nr:helix-turn-helix domain-containing protein [Deinococcus marmoris]